ncbi:hypothetical protein Q5O24_05270 [Eubacteriaceae bacterium ES3]|nr:hypothetical protein Q5O24_05270 [Eubacteriaceae bacterium ES3]
MLRISNIKLSILEAENTEKERMALEKKLRNIVKGTKIKEFHIFKKSIDARKKDMIYFIYTLDFRIEDEKRLLQKNKAVSITPDFKSMSLVKGSQKLKKPPVIVGTGPSGLFAGLILSENGYCPILLEKGADVDTRAQMIEHFWETGELNEKCNVQFGEGGAGTFSDGKLTTQINDSRCRMVLNKLIEAGAPAEILYQSKPHIGTDLLRETVKNIRKQIIKNGGEVRFQSEMTGLQVVNSEIKGLVINNTDVIETELVLIGIGHSSRDTYQKLYDSGVSMCAKSFSIGVRIEHPQELINTSQYGKWAGHPALGAADYKLAYHGKNERSAYTFCMCPGGAVVASSSEKDGVVTNGMSEHARNGVNANAALLVGVNPEDFGSEHPLAGVEFQRKWERAAFFTGGENYFAPAQLLGDFLEDRESKTLGTVNSTYKPGIVMTDLKKCLPDYVVETMKVAILEFDKKIKGFSMSDAILTGVETRSSAPLRILRDEKYESNLKGLFPMGEGAGYAGGIMSSAVDGIKTAEKIIERFSCFDENRN